MVDPVERPVAIVTGASSGFGNNIAHELAARDWLVVGVARTEHRLEALAKETNGEYEVCDVSDPSEVGKTALSILDRHPDISLLVNSAGMPLRERTSETDAEKIIKVLETNCAGSIWVVQALLPGLKAGGSTDVIDIVSAAATINNPNSGPYTASKAAQLSASRVMREDLRPLGINVHAILPGKADTEGHPQAPSNSLFSKLTRTDVDTVTQVVMDRIGQRPKEVYVPGILKVAGVASSMAPVQVTRAVSKLLS